MLLDLLHQGLVSLCRSVDRKVLRWQDQVGQCLLLREDRSAVRERDLTSYLVFEREC